MSFEIPSAATHFETKNFLDKIALIDTDRYKYLATYRMFQELQNGKEHSISFLEEIIEDYLFRDVFSAFKAKAYIFCFSAPSSHVFRNSIALEKPYKGNRKGKADLYDYEQKFDDMAYVYKYISDKYVSLLYPDLEADDLLSMLQHPESTFIFSHDKDLKQVIGYHYDMTTRILMYTDEDDGFQKMIYQILKGDTTDNIPGLYRFGDAALEKFIEETSGMNNIELLNAAILKFIEKDGVIHGTDCFVEMWNLISMRLNRGKHNREKYDKAFSLVESLIQEDNEINAPTNSA